ncbi:MAG TPA: prolyl oligopeptidase family serine peptidase [Gammaproteobacteria bacterium]|nr:prolyl oligopeptidase family serine peptidase [Gammaproteobacteria bacterium]
MSSTTQRLTRRQYNDVGTLLIFGISYGGYAAIRSAEIAPDLYQCTVGDAGVYDLPMMVDDSGDSRSYFDKVFRGLTQADLAQQSPVNHVKRLTGGIYLVQGGADYTVSPKQFDELKKRLDAAGKHYLSLYKQYEGHGFGKVSDRRELAKKLLTFFNHWIGPQSGQQVAAASR